MLSSLTKALRRFRKSEKGSTAIEFILVFPAFIALFGGTFEIGLLMTKQMMLEHAMDMSMRAIRLSNGSIVITHDNIRDKICEDALILQDCQNTLRLEMVRIPSDTWKMPNPRAGCVDRKEKSEPRVAFSNRADNDIMFLRACVIIDPILPGGGMAAALTRDASGGYQMIATSAFSVEPS